MNRQTVAALLVGLVLGLVVGAAGVSVLTPTERVSTPSTSISAATGCTADPIEPGWIGQYGEANANVVAIEFVLTHESAAINHTSTIDEPTDGAYRLRITTEPDASADRRDPPDDCQPRTRMTATVGLSAEYDTLALVVDNTTLTTVDAREGSFPTFEPFNGTLAVN